MKQTIKSDELIIDCKDIYLREYRAEDLEKLQEITWQPEVYEFLPGWNAAVEERALWLTQYEIPENQNFKQAVLAGGDIGDLYLRLAIVLKENDEFIGWCCSGIKDELPAPNREIMYGISKHFRNRGFTTQAVQGITQYLFQNTNVEVLNAIALLTNQASNKVIQKCNFEWMNLIEIENEPYNHYQLRKQ
ncbi:MULTISPECIES: GNAT family N-acetyltransferase [Paenibacillus]|uniref:GNAT family N-acetyltransferase n=1 Tax=Paenibacillus TaxID=44249 RepID=UPI000404A6A6|nr:MULTISPECIES: GNAT family N-acetyltransferase [Paenibacillus]KGP85170.1 acetyltransferase [Paenibacillus sp. MAEPY2]KGP87019.1 acetyltransferase [Paenibacillus sp. MAEPY1]OZQ72822.1 N-acetyltransferase [Paenibacillus taichungensis]HBU81946.1 N-acetyltransferase [Paenibacillus sp.]